MDPMEQWQQRLRALRNSSRSAEKALAGGSGYIYRIALTFFDAALIEAFTETNTDWRKELQRALDLMERSAESGDCQKHNTYPFNLASLRLEQHLGGWFIGEQTDLSRLNQAINLFVEEIYRKEKQPLRMFSPLPLCYLLRQDSDHLNAFWDLLGKKTDLEHLPAELQFWRRVTQIFQQGSGTSLADRYLEAYRDLISTLSSPMDQPVRFYLGVARTAIILFEIKMSSLEAVQWFAIESWKK
jgi:hypothetical protein